MPTFSSLKLFTSSGLVWAIALLLAWSLLWLPLAIPVAWAVKWRPPMPIAPQQKIPLLASLYLLAPLVVWGALRWDNIDLAECGLVWRGSMLLSGLLGLAVGAIGVLFLFWVESILGWVTWQWSSQVKTVCLPVLLLGVWVSATEEVMFRGLFQTRFQQDYELWVAAAIVSLIFALLHLVWEGTDNLPQLPGLWLMGMVLTLARVVDGGYLGLTWGLHAGWIWGMATLDSAQVISVSDKGSPWLTGLAGKPLAGLMGILFLAATGLILVGVGFVRSP